MNLISIEAKKLINTTVHLLNQPLVKEGVKNIAGSVTFAFGLIEMYDIYQIVKGGNVSSEIFSKNPTWLEVANKTIIVAAKISLILSAGVSRPGVFIVSSLMGEAFSTTQLNTMFGANTIFAVNPYHPRHIVSIAAVILALPSIVQSVCKTTSFAYKKVMQFTGDKTVTSNAKNGLTDAKIRLMTFFNTITSRPTLHLGNQLGNFLR